MANTVLTHQMIAREAAAILEEEAPFLANINKGRKEEFGADNQGYKKGGSVTIKVPTAGKVFHGAEFAEGGDATDFKEDKVTLDLDTQKHIALEFGAKEKLLDITDFRERILRPQIQTLSSVVEADLLQRAYKETSNTVALGTGYEGLVDARNKLNQFLTPSGQRSAIVSGKANKKISTEVAKLFNPTQTSDKAYLQGFVGKSAGFDIFEHQSTPVHTANGTAATITTAGANQSGDVIKLKAGTAGTLLKGTIFTIAGIYAVHPLTGLTTGDLQQFVVRADTTVATTATDVPIYPAISASQPGQTVTALAADGVVATVVSVAGNQNLAFHKDAFTAAFAPLGVLAGCEGYTARMPNGMSIRVMTFGDGKSDSEGTRIDVLYGFAAVRGNHAVRITE